jgi:hypothetical protein
MMRDGECRGVVSLFFALYCGGEPVCFLPSRLSYRGRLHAFHHLGPAMVHPTLLCFVFRFVIDLSSGACQSIGFAV